MTHAQRRARELQRELGLHGQVDAEGVANHLGLEVWTWPFQALEEMQVENAIAVAERLDARWRRWVIAHAIGHSLLHPGNHLWVRDHTLLGHRMEREAEEFAGALLMDGREAFEQGLVHPWEVAEYFGVPEEMVRVQGPVLASMHPQRGVSDRSSATQTGASGDLDCRLSMAAGQTSHSYPSRRQDAVLEKEERLETCASVKGCERIIDMKHSAN